MHKRFNFNTFFFNSKSPQKKEKRKKKKRIGMLDYIWLQMREEKRREMNKRREIIVYSQSTINVYFLISHEW